MSLKCSLIIPVYNEESCLRKCLESCFHQSLPSDDYEVIVVDDGSSDGSVAIAQSFPVRVVEQKNQGPAKARNSGAEVAQGRIFVFTDADCYLSYHFLKNMTDPILSGECDGVQGVYGTEQKEFMSQFVQKEIESRYDVMKKNQYIDHIGTYAAAYSSNVFCSFDGFCTDFKTASGEDTEFSHRLASKGHLLKLSNHAQVFHEHPSRFFEYLRIKFYRGYWRVLLYSRHPERVLKDSYTPQILKFEVAIAPVFLCGLFLSLWFGEYLVIGFSLLTVYGKSSFDIAKRMRRPIFSFPLVLISVVARSLSLWAGLVAGSCSGLISRS
ncbi:MAG: glycosyltransferase family 2 protein [Oligoflexales bacterium]